MTFLDPVPSDEDINLLFQNLYRQEKPFLPELAFYFSENKSPEHIARVKKDFDEYLDFLEQAQKPGHLLDLGCGEGFFLNVAQQRGWIPDGVDSSQDAVKRAKEKFNLSITLGTVESVDFPENRFDAVTLLDFAEHLSQPQKTYEKIHRWLKPEGVMLIATPNQASILAWAAHLVYLISFGTIKGPLYRIYMLPHFLYYTPSTLTELLNKTGFEILSLKKNNTDLRRLHLPYFMQVTLEILFGISNLAGLQNRITLIARKV
jgi:2-polyprenyl-3-methyl-5-hydroxy-6-metoxy-1,4-benzoquinol methylase